MPPKKEEKKAEDWNLTPTEGVIALILFLALLSSVAPAVWGYIRSGELSFFGIELSGAFEFFRAYSWLFKAFGFVVAGAAALATFILVRKKDAVWQAEKEKIYPDNMVVSVGEPPKNPMAERWEKIVKKSESDHPSDWRIAVIEADIILSDLLDNLRLPGETIGEKLKAVERSDFVTIDLAWEAHKARNMIAHEGSDFMINKREVRRIISLYEAVFKEFCLI